MRDSEKGDAIGEKRGRGFTRNLPWFFGPLIAVSVAGVVYGVAADDPVVRGCGAFFALLFGSALWLARLHEGYESIVAQAEIPQDAVPESVSTAAGEPSRGPGRAAIVPEDYILSKTLPIPLGAPARSTEIEPDDYMLLGAYGPDGDVYEALRGRRNAGELESFLAEAEDLSIQDDSSTIRDEEGWLDSADPEALGEYLPEVSDRKMRLFGCACCRRLWHLLEVDWSRRAVEVAEAHADGLASAEEWAAAHRKAVSACRLDDSGTDLLAEQSARDARRRAAEVAVAASDCNHGSAWDHAFEAARRAHDLKAWPGVGDVAGMDLDAASSERMAQAALLRDIVGNPFRRVTIDPQWLLWDGGVVRRIAQAIYDEGRFGDMPILADALEDAGCGDAEILNHLRGPGPHARGCFLLDLLLGKE